MHSRLDVAVIAYPDGELRALIDVQGRAWDGAVVGEHAQLGAVDLLADREDAQVEDSAVIEPDHARARHFGQSCRIGSEQFLLVHLSSFPPGMPRVVP